MSISTIGLLHPGEMGVTVGAAACENADVIWARTGRSEATIHRAESANLTAVASFETLVTEADMIICVCPPHGARSIAEKVAASAFKGLYVDANAISPRQTREIATLIQDGGCDFVDGSLIGPPAKAAGSTRLYLSGVGADAVAVCFRNSVLDARTLGDDIGKASALKMTYAAWTKGTDALLMAIRALAEAEDVEEALLSEWDLSQAGVSERSVSAVRSSAPKGWRFAAEMSEIADTFAANQLPAGFHEAAHELYRRLDCFKDQFDPAPALPAVIEALRSPR